MKRGKVRVHVARLLEALVEVALDALPDRVPVGPDGERSAYGAVVGEFGHPDEVQYHLLGSSLFFVSFSTASVIRMLLSPCKCGSRKV
jgi:hypothetical protein